MSESINTLNSIILLLTGPVAFVLGVLFGIIILEFLKENVGYDERTDYSIKRRWFIFPPVGGITVGLLLHVVIPLPGEGTLPFIAISSVAFALGIFSGIWNRKIPPVAWAIDLFYDTFNLD